MQGMYISDGELFCEAHAPDGIEKDLSPGEYNTPQNCSICGKPLEYTLTPDGMQYIFEKIAESILEPESERNRIIGDDGIPKPDYYQGSRHCEIVRDWAKDLKNYGLDHVAKLLVDTYLELTAEPKPLHADPDTIRQAIDKAQAALDHLNATPKPVHCDGCGIRLAEADTGTTCAKCRKPAVEYLAAPDPYEST